MQKPPPFALVFSYHNFPLLCPVTAAQMVGLLQPSFDLFYAFLDALEWF